MALRNNLILRRPRSGRLEGRTTCQAWSLDAGARGGGDFGGQAEFRRQAALDRGARAGLRVNRHRAAMQLNEALDQGQAEPGARFAGIRVAALELVEDPLL